MSFAPPRQASEFLRLARGDSTLRALRMRGQVLRAANTFRLGVVFATVWACLAVGGAKNPVGAVLAATVVGINLLGLSAYLALRGARQLARLHQARWWTLCDARVSVVESTHLNRAHLRAMGFETMGDVRIDHSFDLVVAEQSVRLSPLSFGVSSRFAESAWSGAWLEFRALDDNGEELSAARELDFVRRDGRRLCVAARGLGPPGGGTLALLIGGARLAQHEHAWAQFFARLEALCAELRTPTIVAA